MSIHGEGDSRIPMTEEQREELRKRLEKETEDYFKDCKRSNYKEGWNEATWEKEMAEHPLFAQEAGPSGNYELPPLLEALRQIKYDDSENSPTELAQSYKEDGNNLFKKHDYRAAIASYSEGLRQKSMNQELNAQLFLNRAAAQFHLNNFNTSLEDCLHALSLKADYLKAMHRAATCCWNLRKLDECDEFCRQILTREPNDKEAEEFLDRTEKERKIIERNKRKREKEIREKRQAQEEMAEALRKAGVTLNPEAREGEILPDLTPQFSALRDFTVNLKNSRLFWPVALVYPELKETDFVQRWDENSTFKQMLDAMYGSEPFERPVAGNEETVVTIKPSELRVCYKSSRNDRPITVNIKQTLRQVLSQKDFIVEDGVPSFWILRKDSDFEKKFLKEQGN